MKIANWAAEWIVDPNYTEALKLLESARSDGDIFSIENYPILGNHYNRKLVVEFDDEVPLYWPYIVIDGKDDDLYYENVKAEGKWVDFAGGEVADILLSDDFELIKSIVKEFLDKGKVKSMVDIDKMKGKWPTKSPHW